MAANNPFTDPTLTDGAGAPTKTDGAGARTLTDATMTDATLTDAARRSAVPVPAGAPDKASFAKGSVLLGTYTVLSAPIKGGMGMVYRVHHTGWNVDLAVKRPKESYFQTEKQKTDFIGECERWINLGLHPNIVSCYYVRELDGIPSVFSEWMDGGSLSDQIRSGKLYEGTDAEVQERLLDISIQFARGLLYSHQNHLIHQDVKPGNLMLTKDYDAKVTDFGISGGGAGKDASGWSGACTREYASAEQQRKGPFTPKTDIYSWAVSVLMMYVGSRPWQNGIDAGLDFDKHAQNVKVPLSDALKALLKSCLEQDVNSRPESFAPVIEALLAEHQAQTGQAYPREEPTAAADTADSLNNRALSFLDLGKPEEAERLWERALTANASHPAANVNDTLYLWEHARIDGETAVQRMENAGMSEERLALFRELYAPRLSCKASLSETNAYAMSTAAFSDDGSCFACSRKSERNTLLVEVRSAKDGALLASMAPEGGHRLHRIQFLRGSTAEVVFATEGTERLTLWNWKTEATISQYEEPTAFKTTTEGRGPYTRTIKTPIDHNTFDDFALLPDGKAVLAVSRNKGLRIWPLEQGKPMRQLAAFTGGTALALTADGACACVAHGEK